LREGIPAGIFPLMYIPVAVFFTVKNDEDNCTSTIVIMTAGTIFLHLIICFGGDSRTCNLPSWINYEMSSWALYSYLTAFLFFDGSEACYDDYSKVIAVVYILLTAIILDHPLLNVIGFIIILTSLISMVWASYIEDDDIYYEIMELYVPCIIAFLCGFGLIGLSGFISRTRRNPYVLACCRSAGNSCHSCCIQNDS